MASKTIQIFLKDADKEGVKIADLSNSLARVYVIPRRMISFVQTRTDLNLPALYMLFDDERTTVYIGESESFSSRINQHIAGKVFWQWAVVCISTSNGMDKADVKFLESYAIKKAIEVSRFEVQNRTNPSQNNLHEFKLASTLDLFNDFELLITTLGFNLYQPLKDEMIGKEITVPKNKGLEKDVREYDTIVCPASGDGREEVFVKKSAWWAIRVGQASIPKLKYIALYETAPYSAIRHYAKITKIEPYPEKPGKYIVYHDGDIKQLEKPLTLDNNPELALYGPRYYKLEDIIASTNLAELTEKTFGANYKKIV